jgi:phosphoribosylanthranilate isomerase
MRLFLPGAARVKICGITSEADARMAVAAGADALGFNFYAGSKRGLTPEASLDWIATLAGAVDRVAVVVNASRSLLGTLVGSGCFEMIQFHGDETPEQCAGAGVGVWMKAVRVRDVASLGEALRFPTPYLLLDAWVPGAYGGTGAAADWGLVRGWVAEHPERQWVLAGGLTPGNVAEAIRVVCPAAVDVAGGVESAPGKKDTALVQGFVAAARAASVLG